MTALHSSHYTTSTTTTTTKTTVAALFKAGCDPSTLYCNGIDDNGRGPHLSLIIPGLDGSYPRSRLANDQCSSYYYYHCASCLHNRYPYQHQHSQSRSLLTHAPMATRTLYSYSTNHHSSSATANHGGGAEAVCTLHEVSSPGSPPELTNSKSSKSSSFHSSSLSDAINNDLAHFEDVTLDDFGEQYIRKMADTHVKPRPNTGARLLPSSSTVRARDLTSTKHSGFSQSRLGGSPVVPDRESIAQQMSLNIPPKQLSRRRRPRPPQPNSLLTSFQNKRSRSTSPVSSLGNDGRSSSQGRLSVGTSPRPGSFESFAHARRQSWQPGRRKTVKELEDEYDDLDEDLPEDAVIWNVPISPRPPQEREKSRSPRQSWSSTSHSPVDVGRGLGLDFSQSANPMPVQKPPRSPRLSSLPRSVSMTSIPEDYSLNPRSGVKSWDATMSDLSAEARMLTQVLEERAEEREREAERTIQNGGSPSKHNAKRAVSASTIELPPMRRGELMIDPLPVSKEKEKFLTRTRPSWLPPKDPEEEKRHLREYQKMMAKSLEAEKRKARQQQVEQYKRDHAKESIARVWQENVLPNWDERIKDPKTRDLWWKGVTPRDRGHVWAKAVGNELGLSESSYNLALERAKAVERRLAALGEQEAEKEKEWRWFSAIRQDVKEAFPELKIFQPEGPLHDTLIEVLMAYAMYRSDVGYVYGIHFPAALLILNLSGPAAFITLANIFNRPIPAAFLTSNSASMSAAYKAVLSLLEKKISVLHAHLTNPQLELSPDSYLGPFFQSLFCSQRFGMDIASRIWDVYVFEGEDETLIHAACATLAKLEGKLYGSRDEILDALSEKQYSLGKEDDFMDLVRQLGNKKDDKRPNSW
ncbi:uncharacterized protein PV09_05490 [Verruconis gallopava]|uniref:Rab-GAP TBC domain-containing protein n=1 Tax=Verruconis gallopava TaxID=253628 RepID=A0A0D2A930_9PEZI|nr:uncharacterized protein PV09_05490 [Verruconis gallopava]KIW03273.1 hypothetical protein PV09_05490 [Verruconis gallopava]